MLARFIFCFMGVALLACGCANQPTHSDATASKDSWPAAVESQLKVAGRNAPELLRALQSTEGPEREGMLFLVENMPAGDAQTLKADFLIENVRLSYQTRAKAPWREQVPGDVFLNDVLPYASMSEERDAWRARLQDLCAPIVAGCKTPGEAAQRLNQQLFKLTNVRYSTDRKRPDQNITETIQSGKATCTGLSILLVNACRSVGVPARVAGTPMWANMRGNHTWVEIWDGGWHFTGAAEPDAQGLDRGWFVHDASQARADVPRHAIYATSFKPTGLSFPLVWAPQISSVASVNVTDRYVPKVAPVSGNKTRLLVKVLDGPAGKRVASSLTVTDAANPAVELKGKSKDESADLNDIAAFEVTPGRNYRITALSGFRIVSREIAVSGDKQELVTLTLSDLFKMTMASQACYVSPAIDRPLKAGLGTELTKALSGYFSASADQQSKWRFPVRLEALLKDNEPAVRQAAWDAYRNAPIHEAARADFASNRVRSAEHVSPYTLKTVGVRPTNGWPLFIAMHGGGGAPPEVNDSQWKVMQRYYRDHPETGGYLYVALRAPNNTWNGFYDVYVYPLIANLVRQFQLFGDTDPNKVFIMGYSHGGYGAFAIGPKMPDRFAAIHASAAAPTDGETTGETLRNTVFSVMVGEKDTDYGRRDRVTRFASEIQALRGERSDIYPVTVDIKDGFAHSGLPDKDKIVDMYPAVRNPVPRELSWLMTDQVITDFFWLHVKSPGKKQEILASCRDNRVVITANSNVVAATVLLDARLIDFRKPVQVELNGATTSITVVPSLRTLCDTLARRGDAELAFTGSFGVGKDERTGRLVVTGKP